MKIKCDFCKTEYTLDKVSSGGVKCAICGNVWAPDVAPRKNTWLMFFASLCALLSAIVFTVAIITQHQAKNANRGPLVVDVDGVETITDEDGKSRIAVSGRITNVSDVMYALPDLIILSSDENGRVLAQQKFMPMATFLDVGVSTKFRHILGVQPNGVRKISAKLADFQEHQGEK